MNRPSLKSCSFKTLLALGTALGSIAGAGAQSVQLPRASDGETVARSPIGLDAGISRNGNTLNVQLRAAATVIDWKGFNVPEGATADFRTAPLIGQAAVLNRDISGARSQLLGNITSGDNVAVWVMNPSGILVGGRAAFSTGSLVLTTLDVNQSDFLANGNRFGLSAPGTRTAGIEVVNGARINTADGPRGLVMVAPQIDANGTFDAGDGNVAFVTATDVTLNYNPGSPLSVTLNRGTSVAARSQFVRGTVAGGDALFALASQGSVTDALLQVDAGVTTAQAGTRGIVLSAGRPASAVSGVATSSTAGAADGVASLLVQGALTTRDTNGGSDILAGASGAAGFTGALVTNRNVTVASGGALSVAGAVTARNGDYTLTGAGVTLGRAPTAPSTTPVSVVQQAGGAVSIRAENGDIAGRAGLTLRSGGTDAITLTSAGTTAGNIAFATGSTLEAGSNRGGALTISLRDAASTLALGNVRADVLRGAVGNGPFNDRLAVASGLTLGDVDVRRSLDITAGGGLSAGDLLSDRAVTLNVAGTLTADTVRARGGDARLTGSGATTVTNTLAAAGNNADVLVTRSGLLTLNNLSSARNIAVDAGTGSAIIAGNVTAGLNYTVSGDAVTLGGVSDVRQAANGDVRITAGGGGITGQDGLTLLANADANGSDAFVLAIDPTRVAAGAGGGAITFASRSVIAGGEQATTDIQVRSADANGAVTLGDVVARQLLGGVGTAASTTGITRSAAVTVGDVTTRGDVVLSGTTIEAGRLTSLNGAVRVSGTSGAVTTGTIEADGDAVVTAAGAASLGRIATDGSARVDASGVLTLRSGASVGGDLLLSGAAVTLGGATFTSGGAIDVRATSGGIAGTGAVALTSTSTDAGDFVRLQATSADGIVFGSGSRIVAGTNRSLRVGVFNATAGASLVLGDVSARSLGALAALNGDATRPAGAIIAAGDLTFARLDLVDGFAAESSGGDLSVGAISVTGAGGGISLRAAGTLNVQRDVAASGNVTLASGADLTLGTVQSRDGRASVTSAGTARVNTLAGALGATLEGGTIVARELRGGTVRAVASTGDATLGRAVGTDVTLSAAGLASLAGLDASGDAQVTGGTVTLSGTQTARGRYTAGSTAGALTGAAGLSITSDADGTGGAALALSARGGAIGLDPGAQLVGGANGDGAVSVTTDGAGVTLGRVRAGSLTVTGATGATSAIRTGDLRLGSDLTLSAAGGVGTGAIEARDVAIDGGAGDATSGDIRAAAVTLRGAGVRFGAASVSSLSAAAGGGDVNGGTVEASGAVQLAATSGAVTTGRVSANTLEVTAGTDTQLGDIDVTSAVTLRAAALRFGNANVGSLAASAGSGDVTGGTVEASGAVQLVATSGAVTTGGVSANTLEVTAGTDAQLGDLGITSAATLRAAALRFGNANVGSLVAVAGGGDVNGGTVEASGAVQVTAAGGGVTLGPITADTLDVTATRAGLGDLSVATGATLRAGTLRFGNARVGSLSALAEQGELSGGDIDATGAVSANATAASVTLGRLTTAGDLTVAAGTDARLAAIDAGGATTLTGATIRFDSVRAASFGATARTGDVIGGGVDVDRAIAVEATAGAVTLGRVATRAGATLSAAHALRIGDLAVAGDATLRGGSVGFGAGEVGALRVDALTGGVSGGDVTSAGGLSVQAVGGASFGRLVVSGDTALTAGGTIALTSLDGRSAATLTTTGVNSDVVSSDGIAAVGMVAVTAGGSIRAPFVRSVQGDLTIAAPTGEVTGFAPGSGIALSAGTGRAFTLRVGRAAVLGDLGGGSVQVEAPSLSVGAVDAGSGSVTLRATDGDLSVGGRVTGGAVTLGATSRALLGDVVASGTLAVSSGAGGVASGTLSGASIDVRSTGNVSGGGLRSTGGLTVGSSSVSIGQIAADAASINAAAGDLAIDTLAVRGDAALSASGNARVTGAVQVGGAYRVTGASVTLGAAEQRAGGDVRLTAGAGGVSGLAGLVLGGGRVLIDSEGALALADTRVDTNGTLGLRVASGRAVRLGTVRAGAVGGFDGNAATAMFEHDAAFTADDVTAGALAVRLAAGDLRIGRLVSNGTAALFARDGAITTGGIDAGALSLSGGGAVTTGTIAVRGAASLSGSSISLGDVQAGTLTINSAGAVSGGAGAAPALTTTAGDLSVTAGTMRLGALRSAGAATLNGETISVAGRLAAARALLAEARAALTLADAGAGDAMTLKAGGALTTGALDAGGALAASGAGVTIAGARSGGAIGVTSTGALSTGALDAGETLSASGAGVTIASARSGGAIGLTSTGALSTGTLDAGGALSASGAGVTIAGARSGGAIGVTSTGALTLTSADTGVGITINAAGLATLGTLSGGSAVNVTANDAELGGAIRATNVTFATRNPATTALRVGDGTGNDGFRLSAAELNRVTSDRLRLDAGAGTMEVGTIAFGTSTGGAVDMLSTGDVRVTGAVSAAGANRTIRVGGGADEGTMANTIHLVATSDAGGRLLLADNNLDLRGQRIAAGLAPGFIDTLQPGEPGVAQAAALIGNGNSALYNTQFGGGFFSPLANTLLAARSLTVRFGDYALFQNTGVPGTFAGVALGSPMAAASNTPVLRVSSTGNPAQASFALFGTVNGVGDAGAALLGTNVVDIDPRLLATSRINGCLAGSGAGCLTTIVIQPTLQVFNWNSADVFGISQDVSVPFQPIIGGNNEGLLTGLPELAPSDPNPVPVFVSPPPSPAAPAVPVIPVLSAKEALRP